MAAVVPQSSRLGDELLAAEYCIAPYLLGTE
jgi:hypothetical protein